MMMRLLFDDENVVVVATMEEFILQEPSPWAVAVDGRGKACELGAKTPVSAARLAAGACWQWYLPGSLPSPLRCRVAERKEEKKRDCCCCVAVNDGCGEIDSTNRDCVE